MFTIFSPQKTNDVTYRSYRPTTSSPLTTSSPPRPSPLSPVSANRQAGPSPSSQSSPIRGPPTKLQETSKFASRPVKKTPLARSRQEAQEGRRRLFLQGAKQRSEDKTWQRRDIEGFTIKKTWLEETAERQMRNFAEANEMVTTDSDFEDAAASWAESGDLDEMMVEDTVRFEQMALDAMLAGMDRGKPQSQLDYLMDEDDDDFDQLLVGLVESDTKHDAFQNTQSSTDVAMGN